MKKILLLAILLMGVSMYSQEDNYYIDVKTTVDPSVLIKEGNFNIKLEGSVNFNMSEHWRANAVIEILTGHNGYYGADVGAGFSIPYSIGNWNFKVEPGVGIGLIYRPNMPTLVTYKEGVRTYSNPGFLGFSHSLNIRHQLQIGDSRWSGYIHNRLILRSDLHFEDDLTATPEGLPFYNYDNAVGVVYRIN